VTPTPKPSLAGILQRKGEATRPAEIPQRGIGEVPAAKGDGDKPKLHSLTLRLDDARYQRLREYAFRRNLSHQAVMLDGLDRVLDGDG